MILARGGIPHEGEGLARALLADADDTGATTDQARYGVRAQTLGEFRLLLATSADRWIEVTNSVRWGMGGRKSCWSYCSCSADSWRAFRQAYGSEPEPLRRLVAEIRADRFLVERLRRNSGVHWRIAPADVEER